MSKNKFDKNKINYEMRKNNCKLPYYIIRDYKCREMQDDEIKQEVKCLNDVCDQIEANKFFIESICQFDNNLDISRSVSIQKERQKANQSNFLEKKFKELENEKMKSFFDVHYYQKIKENDPLCYFGHFLYHGIRFGNQLDVLESIFQEQAILAGKYVKNCWWSDDTENCNEGEYVSLIDIVGGHSLGYETFVSPNISLIVSPYCEAVKTIYLPYDEYIALREMIPNPQNRYSYESREYQVKARVDMDYIKAVGVPYNYLTLRGKEAQALQYLENVKALLEQYKLDLPIVDTSKYNRELVKKKRI